MDPEALKWYSSLTEVGFPTLMVMILAGSYFDVWLWYKHHKRVTDKQDADYLKLEEEKDQWKAMALGSNDLMGSLVQKVKRG